MKINRSVHYISLALTVGFLIGFFKAVYEIIANHYFQYRMYRLIVQILQKYHNKWLFNSLIVTLFIVLFLFFIQRIINLFLKSKSLVFQDTFRKQWSRIQRWLIVVPLCGILFYYAGWYMNYYWLPSRFHPISLLADVILLILCISLGYGLLKVRLKTSQRRMKTLHITAMIVVLFTVMINLLTVWYDKQKRVEGPNIFLIVVDALRADALGCYGNHENTPNLDAFAKEAHVFKTAWAQSPCTINSAPSIFCSVYPAEHGYFDYQTIVPSRLNSLAEILKNRGYQTIGISTNPHVTSHNGLDQGFHTFIEDFAWQNTDCREVNRNVLKWLKNRPQKPFFAMLWYIDPHSPYDPPDEYQKKMIYGEDSTYVSDRTKVKVFSEEYVFSMDERRVTEKLYNAEVAYFDTEFDQFITSLKLLDLYDNSLILFTSDHGESFWEKQSVLGEDLLGHGSSLYEEQIRIPFILKCPNQNAGSVIYQAVQHMDIVPTILDYTFTGWKSRNISGNAGISLKQIVDGDDSTERVIYSQLITDQYGPYRIESVQTRNYKLVLTKQYKEYHMNPLKIQSYSLHDKETELETQKIVTNPSLRDLRKRLEGWPVSINVLEMSSQKGKKLDPKEEERLRERLKSLGYF